MTEIPIKQTEIITMQHIITDEEVKRFDDIYVKYDGGSDDECVKAALADFLNNRPEPTLGKLRPIAEMSETVPEGYKRYGWNYAADFAPGVMSEDTHFIDIQLPTPDPEAEERLRFEEAMKDQKKWASAMFFLKNGKFDSPLTEAHYETWKLAKAK